MFAAAVPAVISSICSKSTSTIVAEPIVNPGAVTIPPEIIVPVLPMFLIPAISNAESTTSALEAAAVPAVIPSIISNSASVITAEPILNCVVKIGLASVLFVSVIEPVFVTTVESIAVEI